MNRVVVTGLGIVSSIGNTTKEVLSSLWHGQSGIVFIPEMQDLGFKCCIYGPVKQLDTSSIRKKALQTMSQAAQYAVVSALEALEDANLCPKGLQTGRVGIIVGTGLGGINEVALAERLLITHKSPSRVGATGPVRIMNSTASGNLAAYFGVQGRTYSLSSACSTGLNNIGHAYELLKFGLLDVYAEIVGFGSTNDGADMFEPTGKGLKVAIQQSLSSASRQGIQKIDYINPHGTGTLVGDKVEVRVIKELFGRTPFVSSTKSLTGHGQSAAGAQEAVYTLLMLRHNFVAPTANLHNIAPECTGIRHVQVLNECLLENVMTFNAGLGGTNTCMIFRKL